MPPPCARYGHSLTFALELNILVIHGGKADNADTVYYADTHILKLDDLVWLNVAPNGIPTVPRANHSTVVFGKADGGGRLTD